MSTDTYRQVLIQVQQLTIDEQFQLMQDLLAILRRRVVHEPTHSILELDGLGKEIWEGVDVQEYIDQERASW
jgi:hypothetical protein